MSTNEINIQYNSYFAASNSCDGFISYFDEIFSTKDFDKIFILKGGPGTGKSTFMKSILSELSPFCDESEAIYCSSDVNSLDGIILSKQSKKIAILDGTAPHTIDPKIPGVIDEIINLGDFWSENTLIKNKTEILKANERKSEAYSFAYKYLKICGLISNVVFSIIDNIYLDIAEELIEEITKDASKGKIKISKKLLSSYSKIGFTRLTTINKMSKRKYYVPGVYGSEYIFMDNLYEELNRRGIEFTVYPSALFKHKIDTIFIPSTNTAIMLGKPTLNDKNILIDSAKYIDQNKLSYYKYRLEYLWHEREVMLWGAIDEFKKASDEHFSLERLYTASMDFDKEKDKLYNIKDRIKEILKIE